MTNKILSALEELNALTEKKTVQYIDPPSGWKYGFPKIIPDDVKSEDTTKWLLEQGYPQREIDACGKHFYCRVWFEEVKDDNGKNKRT